MKKLVTICVVVVVSMSLVSSASATLWTLPLGTPDNCSWWYANTYTYDLIQLKIDVVGFANPSLTGTGTGWSTFHWQETINTSSIIVAKGDLGNNQVSFQIQLDTPNGSADAIKLYGQLYNNGVRVFNEAYALPANGDVSSWSAITPLWDQATPVPEPMTLALLGLGGLLLRKKK